MQKLPVFEIIRQSYRFLIEERWTILRLSWFLLLIAVILQVALEYTEIQRLIAANEGADRAGPSSLSALIIGLVHALAIVAVAVALHRVILLGYRAEGTRLYFAVGKVEFLFLMVSFAGITFVLLAVLPLILVMLWADFSPSWGDELSYAVSAVFYGLIFGAFAVFSVRFAPVLPIAVVERNLRQPAADDRLQRPRRIASSAEPRTPGSATTAQLRQ